MKSINRIARPRFLSLLLLFFILALPIFLLAQPTDTVANNNQHQQSDTTKKTTATTQKKAREIVKVLVEQKQLKTLSYTNRKIKFKIEKEAELFQLSGGGESRVALFELPYHVNDYYLLIRSFAHVFGFTVHMFVPGVVFLDSTMRITSLLSEKKFKPLDARLTKSIGLETQVIMDEYRKNDKYMLIYTPYNKSKKLGSFYDGLIFHPVESSTNGKLEVEFHLR